MVPNTCISSPYTTKIKKTSSLSTMKQISIFHKISASISSLEYKYCRLKSKLHPISLCQLSFSSLNFIFCNFSPKCSHLLLARSFPSKTIKNLPLAIQKKLFLYTKTNTKSSLNFFIYIKKV